MSFDWDKDISVPAKDWMKTLGDFSPTVRAKDKLVKGFLSDDDGGCQAYFCSEDLRQIAVACKEVSDWLEKRAEKEEDRGN